MTNVAANNKAGSCGGVAAMIITYQYQAEKHFCTCLRAYFETFMGVFVAINRIMILSSFDSFGKIMLHFYTGTLLIDVCLFLVIIDQGEIVNEGNFAEIWLFS